AAGGEDPSDRWESSDDPIPLVGVRNHRPSWQAKPPNIAIGADVDDITERVDEAGRSGDIRAWAAGSPTLRGGKEHFTVFAWTREEKGSQPVAGTK
ncbi:MAG: hypothetical protein SGI84_11595, partial [Gemmatimonadota bacterium]|nr:hypothetical protein [Gemmatimonadota bacterium]